MRDGVLYVASGERYVDEALRSAHSSLRHNRAPHLLLAAPAPGRNPALEGLEVEPFESCGDPYLDKIAGMRRSPFERTIFLDSDTYVAAEIVHVLDLFDRYDLAAAHAPGYRGLRDPEVPRALHEFNTGVLAWTANERTAAFLAAWEQTFAAWRSNEPFAEVSESRYEDQPAFRRCLWNSGLRVAVLGAEYNLRLSKPATVIDDVRVMHGRHRNPERLAARLNQATGPRFYAPGSPLAAARSLLRALVRR